jgi:hypothetical protein
LAFVLISAALLQHVALAKSSSTGNPSTRMALRTSNIQALVKKIMPTPQLILFLGGSGKSGVIQAFVDFTRKWLSTASVMVCVSSNKAAVLMEAALFIWRLKFLRDWLIPNQAAANKS